MVVGGTWQWKRLNVWKPVCDHEKIGQRHSKIRHDLRIVSRLRKLLSDVYV